MKKHLLAPTLTALVLLAGCGGSDDGNDDATAGGGGSASDVRACSEVWKVGETLDLDTYEGCQDGNTIVAAVTRGCYDANNKYVGQVATFEDRLWVVQEGTDQKTGEGGTPGKVTDVDPGC